MPQDFSLARCESAILLQSAQCQILSVGRDADIGHKDAADGRVQMHAESAQKKHILGGESTVLARAVKRKQSEQFALRDDCELHIVVDIELSVTIHVQRRVEPFFFIEDIARAKELGLFGVEVPQEIVCVLLAGQVCLLSRKEALRKADRMTECDVLCVSAHFKQNAGVLKRDNDPEALEKVVPDIQ